MKNHMEKYAKNYEDALNYLKTNHNFDGKFNENNRGYEKYLTFECKFRKCSCGESSAIWISDEDLNILEVIIICESCYETAFYKI